MATKTLPDTQTCAFPGETPTRAADVETDLCGRVVSCEAALANALATLLEQGLLGIARSEAVVESMRSRHGMKYIVDGAIATPLGSRVKLRTIWIIEQGQEHPRFVTAYPL